MLLDGGIDDFGVQLSEPFGSWYAGNFKASAFFTSSLSFQHLGDPLPQKNALLLWFNMSLEYF